MVTVCPAFTSSGNLFPPNSRTTLAGVYAAPTRTSGPTTRLRGSANAPGKLASDRLAQSTIVPRWTFLEDAVVVDSGPRAGGARRGDVSDPFVERSATPAAAAAVALATAAALRAVM
jgi:hypothetical protein